MSTASSITLQMLLDRSILSRSEPEVEPEAVANTASDGAQELLHPDDIAAMQAAWAKLCEEDEYFKAYHWSSAPSQDVQNNQTSFPTLNQFTAPVDDLPKLPPMVPSQYNSPEPSAVHQAPLEGAARSQPERDDGSSANGPNFAQDYFPTIVDLELWAAGDPRAYGPRPPSQGQHAHSQTGMSTPSATEHTDDAYAGAIADTMTHAETFLPAAPGSDATMYPSDGSSLEPSSPASDDTAFAKPPKRKTCHTVESKGSSSGSSLAPRKRRCLDDDEDEIKEGKFGAYRLANASAAVMAMPVHDPNPVDISNRRTHDANGNLLRTRRFGAMELDDSYSKRSIKIRNELPAEMICVRACDWTDQPCGLFVEMDKIHVSHHLLYWHGVKYRSKAPCRFEDCSAPKAMINLGRHIEGVHYTTSLECPYCGERKSRSDSIHRHQKTCDSFLASKALAKKERRKFNPQVPKKLVYGYIVPARNAT